MMKKAGVFFAVASLIVGLGSCGSKRDIPEEANQNIDHPAEMNLDEADAPQAVVVRASDESNVRFRSVLLNDSADSGDAVAAAFASGQEIAVEESADDDLADTDSLYGQSRYCYGCWDFPVLRAIGRGVRGVVGGTVNAGRAVLGYRPVYYVNNGNYAYSYRNTYTSNGSRYYVYDNKVAQSRYCYNPAVTTGVNQSPYQGNYTTGVNTTGAGPINPSQDQINRQRIINENNLRYQTINGRQVLVDVNGSEVTVTNNGRIYTYTRVETNGRRVFVDAAGAEIFIDPGTLTTCAD